MRSKYRHTRLLFIVLLLLLAYGCTSRYRLDLFVTTGESRTKAKLENSQFVRQGVLASPHDRDKVIPGNGNCLIVTTGSRGDLVSREGTKLMDYDRYLRYKIFLQLPSRLETTSIQLVNSSFVQLMGRYELPAADKIFLAREGSFTVDSLTSSHLFGTIDGRFDNDQSGSVSFQGSFKAKIAD